jgi:rSAM/selenodomain-associated transferase 1
VLALFAKAPVPGQVKTRLCPPLSPAGAAKLYEAMLLDVLDQHRKLPRGDRVVAYAPEDALDWFRRHVRSEFGLLPQKGTSLGERMADLFGVQHGKGFDRIVLRGTDSPTLPIERVEQAFDLLENKDLVLCPDLDGGYNLIGLRTPHDELFALEMSRTTVLEQTIAKAAEERLTYALLPEHYDVDTAEDLDRLEPDLSESRTPRTLNWLRSAR